MTLLVNAGCFSGGSHSKGGDSVSNDHGLGTGTIAGVNFEVRSLQRQKSSGITTSVSVSEGPLKSSSATKWNVQFGEVAATLESVDEGPISLAVDGTSFGYVSEGDNVLIDGQSRVFVNGVERVPEGKHARPR